MMGLAKEGETSGENNNEPTDSDSLIVADSRRASMEEIFEDGGVSPPLATVDLDQVESP